MPRNNFEIYTSNQLTGLITSPGIFEGQPRYLPRFFAHALEGDGECKVSSKNGGTECEFVGILPQDRVDFPELNADPRPEWVFLKYSDEGFVTGSAMTEAQKARIYLEMQAKYESATQPGPITSGKDLLSRIKIWRDNEDSEAGTIGAASNLLDDIENWVNRTLIGE